MRLLLTRPLAEATACAARLAQLGHASIVAPLLRITPLEPPLPDLAFGAVLATSANAFVGKVARRVALQWPDMTCHCVGAKTADAAKVAGFAPLRARTAGADVAEMIAALGHHPPAAFLYLAGVDRKPVLEQALHAAGHAVIALETYEAQAASALPAAAVRALAWGEVDGALHFSRRSAEILLQLCQGADMLATMMPLQHFCLSADVAAPLRQAGAAHVRIAASPDEAALFALLPPA